MNSHTRLVGLLGSIIGYSLLGGYDTAYAQEVEMAGVTINCSGIGDGDIGFEGTSGITAGTKVTACLVSLEPNECNIPKLQRVVGALTSDGTCFTTHEPKQFTDGVGSAVSCSGEKQRIIKALVAGCKTFSDS